MTTTDIAAASKVCAAACRLDQDGQALLAGLLRTPRRATVAVVDEAVVGLCVTSTGIAVRAAQRGDDQAVRTGYVDLLAVDTARQGSGLGARLLEHAERALTGLGCGQVRLEGNPPFHAWPGVDVRYIRAIALAESRGYRRLGVEMTMGVELATAPLETATDEQRLRVDGVCVRCARDDEREKLSQALAFEWKDSWRLELDAALATDGGGVVLATRGGSFVGFCGYGGNRPGEVGPLGVDPQWRGRGLGTVLIRRALSMLAADGHRLGEVPWAGPVALFARTLDATVSKVFVRYGKALT